MTTLEPHTRGTDRAWSRTKVVALVSTVAIGVSMLVPTASQAQTAPETGEIRNGTAQALATVGRYAPGVGQLSLAMTNGIAITQVTNFLAQSTSRVTDLGLIGSSLTAAGCDGGDATITPDQLPQPTFTDNRAGDSAIDRDELGADGSPAGVGSMHAATKKDPVEAVAVTTLADFSVDGVFHLGGGEARAETRVLPGKGREAYARVDGNLELAGGAVKLSGMVWEAYHRTGTDPDARASFSFGQSAVGAIPFDPSQGEAFEDAANTVLEPLGASITMPQPERLTDPADLIRVSPFRLELRDTPVGKTVFGPILDTTREQRSQLFDQLVEFYCSAASALLVADIGISIIAGTGFLVVEFGGVSATSADLAPFNPFGGAVRPNQPSQPVTTPSGNSGSPTFSGVTSPGAPSATPTTVGDVEEALPVSSGPLDTVCESLHPNGTPCSRGAAVLVGVLGLLATIGVAGADLLRQRRRTAITTEV